MSISYVSRWAVLLGVFAIGACDEEAGGRDDGFGGPGGGKADDANGAELDPEIQVEHLTAVGACEKKASRAAEHISVLRTDARYEVEQTRLTCLSDANDRTRSAAVLTLQVQAPELADDVDTAFDAWRSMHASLCTMLVDASDAALEKSASVVEVGCLAEAELRLAEAIEAFVDLGGARALPPTSEDAYGACYDAYEADEVAEVEMDDAEAELADCVEDEIGSYVEDLAQRVGESFPGREPDGVVQDVRDRFEAASETAENICTVLGFASVDGGPEQVEQCRVAAAIWRHEVVGYAVPEFGPEAAADTDGMNEDETPPGDSE